MLTFADLVFDVRFTGSGVLPLYRGTTLRGAFGYALKNAVCHIHHRDCSRCILRSRCAYPAVFEGLPPAERTIMRKYPFIPQPFVLRVAFRESRSVAPGDPYSFGIRLLGPAVEFAPYIVLAMEELGRRGLGRDAVPFELLGVSDGEMALFDPARDHELRAPRRRVIDLGRTAEESGAADLTLHFETPLRMRTRAELNRQPQLTDLVAAAVRRLRVMTHFYGQPDRLPADPHPFFAAADTATIVSHQLLWHELTRYSTRQDRSMVLDGAVGQITYRLHDGTVVPLIQAAAEIHLGKATSFGFGRLRCEVTSA